MDSFQKVIKEDIIALASSKGCLYCSKVISFEKVGGLMSSIDNVLELKEVVCFSCWKSKKARMETSSFLFISITEVLDQSAGKLTEEVKLITVEKKGNEPLISDCEHNLRMLENKTFQCRKCLQTFYLTGEK